MGKMLQFQGYQTDPTSDVCQFDLQASDACLKQDMVMETRRRGLQKTGLTFNEWLTNVN